MIRQFLAATALLAATVLMGAGSAFAASGYVVGGKDNSAGTGGSTVVAGTSSNTPDTITNGVKNPLLQSVLNDGGIGGGWQKSWNEKRQGGGFADSGTGAAAGTGENRFGVWSNFSGSGFSESQSAIATSGQVYTFVVGADYRINDWVLAGLSAGYERQNINLNFNNGTWDANGAVVAPYALVQLIPGQLYLDATAGYVGNSIDLTRNSGVNSADTSGTRFFMASNLTATLESGNFQFRPSIGANWTYQGIAGYTETGTGGITTPDTTIHFGQFLAGGQVGYRFGNVQPYLLAQYVYAYKYDLPTVASGTQPVAYKNSANVGGGLLFALSPRFSGGAQFSSQVGQTDFIGYTGSATIRYQF